MRAALSGLGSVLLLLSGCADPAPPEATLDFGKRILDLPDGAGVYGAKIIEGRLVIDDEPGAWGTSAAGEVQRNWSLQKPSFDDGGGIRRNLWDDVNATLEVRLVDGFAVGDLTVAWSFIESLEELDAFISGGGVCDRVTPAVDVRSAAGEVAQYRLKGPGIVGVGVQLYDGETRVALFCHLWEAVATFQGVVESAVFPSTAPPRANAIDEFPLQLGMAFPARGQLSHLTQFSAQTRLLSAPPQEGHHAGLQVISDGDIVCTKTEPENPTNPDWTSYACPAPATGALQVKVGAIPGPMYANSGPVRYSLDLSVTGSDYVDA